MEDSGKGPKNLNGRLPPRNPKHQVESASLGTDKMLMASRMHGVPDPLHGMARKPTERLKPTSHPSNALLLPLQRAKLFNTSYFFPKEGFSKPFFPVWVAV